MKALEPMTREECWALLSERDIGRVAFTDLAQPTVSPISYTVDDERVVLRCVSEGMAAKLDGQVVALEVDDVTRSLDDARAVVVTGRATRLVQPADLPAQRTAGLATHEQRRSVRIADEQVRGRRFREA